MKALKEKRISLRSLLRRSLVILSLLALVFASCGDSSSDDNSNSAIIANYTGPEIDTVIIDGTGLGTQYMGMPVNLMGITATIIYKDRTIPAKVNTDLVRFSASPRIYTGAYYIGGDMPANTAVTPPRPAIATGDFVGMSDCVVTFNAPDGRGFSGTVALHGEGIWRDATSTQNWTFDPITGLATIYATGYDDWNRAYAQGVQITGINSPVRQRTIYADDDEFDFSGLTLEANYYDGTTHEIGFEDIVREETWRVIPDYQQGKGPNGAYPGYIYITIGDNWGRAEDDLGNPQPYMGTFMPSWYTTDWWTVANPSTGEQGFYFRGITVLFPLDEVYTVAADPTWVDEPIYGEEGAVSGPGFMHYMAPNDEDYWLEIFGDYLMRVQYTGGKPDKVYTVKQWYEKRDVWWNDNFNTPGWVYVPAYDKGAHALAIKGPDGASFTTKILANPAVELYYRGWTLRHPIDVYTTLQGVNWAGEDITYDYARPGVRDNDKPEDLALSTINGWHAAKFEITATYTAYNDTEKVRDFPLVYSGWDRANLRPYDAGIGWSYSYLGTVVPTPTKANPYPVPTWLTYWSNFDTQLRPYLADETSFTVPPANAEVQSFDGVRGAATKYVTAANKQVRVIHSIPAAHGIKAQSKNTSVPVIWTTNPNAAM